jgi:hypothetical protein
LGSNERGKPKGKDSEWPSVSARENAINDQSGHGWESKARELNGERAGNDAPQSSARLGGKAKISAPTMPLGIDLLEVRPRLEDNCGASETPVKFGPR